MTPGEEGMEARKKTISFISQFVTQLQKLARSSHTHTHTVHHYPFVELTKQCSSTTRPPTKAGANSLWLFFLLSTKKTSEKKTKNLSSTFPSRRDTKNRYWHHFSVVFPYTHSPKRTKKKEKRDKIEAL